MQHCGSSLAFREVRLIPLSDSHKYTQVMKGRDSSLERFLRKYLNHMGAPIGILKKKAKEIALLITYSGMSHYDFKRKREEFEKRLHPWFEMATQETLALFLRMRRTTYALSYQGQTEAISRAHGEVVPARANLHDATHSDTPSGGKLKARVELAYSRILRDVLDAFQLSQVLATDSLPESQQAMLDRLDRAFPRKRPDTKPRKVMAKMTEAQSLFDKPNLNDGFLSFGVIEDSEWKQILEDYFREEFPEGSPNRTIYSRVFYSEATEDQGRYEWEIESEATQDFVQKVREGENDAANAQGITDFQWVSIVDSKTDECCLWRDGLTTKEIEDKLDGDHSDDECDAVNPPAHFYCRCRLVPMTEELNHTTETGLLDFEDWLDQKAG